MYLPYHWKRPHDAALIVGNQVTGSSIFLVSDALEPSCSTTLQLCFNRHALYLSSQLHEHGSCVPKQSGCARIRKDRNLH